jgi:hypothetical protein
MISGYGNGIYPRYFFWVVLEIGGSPVVTMAVSISTRSNFGEFGGTTILGNLDNMYDDV